MNDCVFCEIAARTGPDERRIAQWTDAIAYVPLNPVTEGHVILFPRRHVRDALEDPYLTAKMMFWAASWAAEWGARNGRPADPPEPLNIITSVGAAATQSVYHLHLHLVPRRPHDGLLLPWGGNDEHVRRHMENAYLFYSGVTT